MNRPWLLSTALTLSDDDLRQRIRVPAATAARFQRPSPDVAARVLAQNLENIFIPSQQICKVLTRVLSAGQAHLHLYYPDRAAYMRGLNMASSPLIGTHATCITGTAGVGKSAIGKALRRLLCDKVPLDPGSGYPVVELEHLWHVAVDAKRALRDLLRSSLDGRVLDLDSVKSDARLIEAASRIAFRLAVALLVADEWQFITQSSTANALLTRMLHALRFIGVPLFYITNYSACQRLMRRPHEDQHRLMSDPIVVLPEAPDDPSTLDLYQEYCVASDGALLANPQAVLDEIQAYTGGLNRSRIKLLTLAYQMSLERGAREVLSRDLEAAYRSTQYSCFREDAQLLRKQDLEDRPARKDLWCPFPLPPHARARNVQAAKAQEQESVMTQAAISSMTPNERAGYHRLLVACGAPTQSEPKKTRRPSATHESLLEGAARLRAAKKFKAP